MKELRVVENHQEITMFWPWKRKIHVKVNASTYGRLSVVSDILGCSTTQAVELMTNAFLDQRYPGIDAVGKEKVDKRIQAKEQKIADQEMELTGIPMIDQQIAAHSDEITAWILGTLKDPAASEKKKQLATGLGDFMDLMPGVD